MDPKPYLILMVGLPGSGKSTIAELLHNDYKDSVILSTDKIREEFFNDVNDMSNNDMVFNMLHDMIKDNIKSCRTTIVDCCNISMKSRRPIIDIGKRLNCTICAYIVPTLIDECYRRNSLRERKVPDNVIDKMYHGFQIPFYKEGFDIIKIHYANKPIESITFEDIYKPCITFKQNNPNHPEDILDIHQKFVYQKYLRYHGIETSCNPDLHSNFGLLSGVLLHDIGKLFTKKTDEEGISHYYGHANVGAYYLLSTFANNTVNNVYLSNNNLLELCFVPNYHMLPYSWKDKKTHKKYKRIFGVYLYNTLINFNNIDKLKINEKCEGISNGEQ